MSEDTTTIQVTIKFRDKVKAIASQLGVDYEEFLDGLVNDFIQRTGFKFSRKVIKEWKKIKEGS